MTNEFWLRLIEIEKFSKRINIVQTCGRNKWRQIDGIFYSRQIAFKLDRKRRKQELRLIVIGI